MKHLFVVGATLFLGPSLGGATSLAQRVLTLDVESNLDTVVSVGPGEVIPVQIVGVLSGDASDGLAAFAVNLTNTGVSPIDLAGANFELSAPSDGAMDKFNRNLGISNPPGPVPGPTGFGGTSDGQGGLLQIGGGQNTLGNSGPALYPVGPVVMGVALTRQTLAEGTFTVPDGTPVGGEWVLSLNTGLANAIKPGQSGPVFDVAPVEVVIGNSLTILFGQGPCDLGGGGACPECDLNGSGITEGLDIAICTSSANFGRTVAEALQPCCDVNGSGVIEGLDIAHCASSACFGL